MHYQSIEPRKSFCSRYCYCYLTIFHISWLSHAVSFLLLATTFTSLALQICFLGRTPGANVISLFLSLSGCRENEFYGPFSKDINFIDGLVLYDNDEEYRFDPETGISLNDSKILVSGVSNYVQIYSVDGKSSFHFTSWGFYTMSNNINLDPVKWVLSGNLAISKENIAGNNIILTDQSKESFDTPLERNVLVGPFEVYDSSNLNCMNDYQFALGIACGFAVIGCLSSIWKTLLHCFGLGIPMYFIAEISPLGCAICLTINMGIFRNSCNGSQVGIIYLLIPCILSWICVLFRPCLFNGLIVKEGAEQVSYSDIIKGNQRKERQRNSRRLLEEQQQQRIA